MFIVRALLLASAAIVVRCGSTANATQRCDTPCPEDKPQACPKRASSPSGCTKECFDPAKYTVVARCGSAANATQGSDTPCPEDKPQACIKDRYPYGPDGPTYECFDPAKYTGHACGSYYSRICRKDDIFCGGECRPFAEAETHCCSNPWGPQGGGGLPGGGVGWACPKSARCWGKMRNSQKCHGKDYSDECCLANGIEKKKCSDVYPYECSDEPCPADTPEECVSGYGTMLYTVCYDPATHQCLDDDKGGIIREVCLKSEMLCGGFCRPECGTSCHGEYFPADAGVQCCVGYGSCSGNRGCPTWACPKGRRCPSKLESIDRGLGRTCGLKDNSTECCL